MTRTATLGCSCCTRTPVARGGHSSTRPCSAGRAAWIGFRCQPTGPRLQARDCEVADRIWDLRKVAPVDEPVPHCAMPLSTSMKRTLRAATHRFFSFLSSPIPSGSDCSGVASARLHDGAAGDEGAPRTQAHQQTYADRSPAISGNPPGTPRSEGCSGLKARGRFGFSAQSGGVQHLKNLGSEDRLGKDANERVLHVAAQIRTNIYVYLYI